MRQPRWWRGVGSCGCPQLAKRLGVDRRRVRRWRGRWVRAQAERTECEAEDASEGDLEACVRAVLADRARSGAPPTFEPVQVAALIALACEDPAESGRPVSHWTPSELASARFLKSSRSTPTLR